MRPPSFSSPTPISSTRIIDELRHQRTNGHSRPFLPKEVQDTRFYKTDDGSARLYVAHDAIHRLARFSTPHPPTQEVIFYPINSLSFALPTFRSSSADINTEGGATYLRLTALLPPFACIKTISGVVGPLVLIEGDEREALAREALYQPYTQHELLGGGILPERGQVQKIEFT